MGLELIQGSLPDNRRPQTRFTEEQIGAVVEWQCQPLHLREKSRRELAVSIGLEDKSLKVLMDSREYSEAWNSYCSANGFSPSALRELRSVLLGEAMSGDVKAIQTIFKMTGDLTDRVELSVPPEQLHKSTSTDDLLADISSMKGLNVPA
jgi:hypothetical protein